jgi:hypothetical protein
MVCCTQRLLPCQLHRVASDEKPSALTICRLYCGMVHCRRAFCGWLLSGLATRWPATRLCVTNPSSNLIVRTFCM